MPVPSNSQSKFNEFSHGLILIGRAPTIYIPVRQDVVQVNVLDGPDGTFPSAFGTETANTGFFIGCQCGSQTGVTHFMGDTLPIIIHYDHPV